jgi:hypothetical protein
MTKAVGGFPGIELNKLYEYYPGALHLNTGRNCLEYILKAKSYKKIYLPYYTCEVLLEPVNKLNVKFDYYHIDENLDPVFDSVLNDDEVFLYINYFGLKKNTVELLSGKFKNLIIDNTQAFFSKPLNGIDTFYSARKFFGVADGAYLFTDKILPDSFEQDYSYNRMEHLLIRTDKSAEDGFLSFSKNEYSLHRQPIKIMSNLTRALLENIDYEKVKKQRTDNFLLLHDKLRQINEFNIDLDSIDAPMTYPFLCSKGKEIKEKAAYNKIYIDTYWEHVLNKVNRDSLEAKLTNNLLALPVSQMYNSSEIDFVGTYILHCLTH